MGEEVEGEDAPLEDEAPLEGVPRPSLEGQLPREVAEPPVDEAAEVFGIMLPLCIQWPSVQRRLWASYLPSVQVAPATGGVRHAPSTRVHWSFFHV